jgi:hypothetical protein
VPTHGGHRAWAGAIEHTLLWAAVVLVLHGILEFLQLPLYASFADSDRLRYAAQWVHRVRADVAVSTLLYLALSLVLRNFTWLTRAWQLPVAVMTGGGVMYALVREWQFVAASPVWPYTGWMPSLAGIGLAPLLAWAVVPAVAAWLLRRFL